MTRADILVTVGKIDQDLPSEPSDERSARLSTNGHVGPQQGEQRTCSRLGNWRLDPKHRSSSSVRPRLPSPTQHGRRSPPTLCRCGGSHPMTILRSRCRVTADPRSGPFPSSAGQRQSVSLSGSSFGPEWTPSLVIFRPKTRCPPITGGQSPLEAWKKFRMLLRRF
ncbi:hypothetical protein BO78DRAFT_56857 [Aspergillus sclerotiicarbonarius CBS 121057]|uniref:Uncharacterized protein n=1 Tax=Aspergillus sclerotiicarbonarius (strain CBS 121057 / IBT 28362) TaxID=1448318 RepID=A0A319F154_ASPSB|nr:hypothetical protein BO78DRAFT_56857 [Aspergillus sclerotiicarbonarius CBS 121057]